VTWVLVGPRRGRATSQEERRLAERHVAGMLTFDRRPCGPATMDDVDIAAFAIDYLPRAVGAGALAGDSRTLHQQMAALRFADARRGVPTHVGLLAFGRHPQQFVPGAYLQFVRFDGTSRADRVLDSAEIRGPLREQLIRIDALLAAHVRRPRAPGSGLRYQERPDYPWEAIREVVVNALMHRTYEMSHGPVMLRWHTDRVEVSSPGGLFGQVTPDNFEHVNDYRNPAIAEVLKVLGYVERFGSGIARIKAALAANGNPPASFHFDPTFVQVTLHAVSRHIDAATKGRREPGDEPAMLEPGSGDDLEPVLPEDGPESGRTG